ncbi:hypothetical protein Asp14428_16170 [Actinoplanes sp. NBRC 14428]|nr:hypothetical protein Asp14428_16170 [Actinoplanes sp. NBRC 14428]
MTTGVPSASADRSTVNRSIDTARWAGSTSRSAQRNVVAPEVRPGRPLAITLHPRGTVAVKRNAARSRTSSWAGNQALEAPSKAVAPPDSVVSHPSPGAPSYSTRTVNRSPPRTGRAGTTTRSFAPS